MREYLNDISTPRITESYIKIVKFVLVISRTPVLVSGKVTNNWISLTRGLPLAFGPASRVASRLRSRLELSFYQR